MISNKIILAYKFIVFLTIMSWVGAKAMATDSVASSNKAAILENGIGTNSEEKILVTGKEPGYRTAYGRAGSQAGGGLIQPQTETKSVSEVSSQFIQMQAPTSNPYNLIRLLPGANVSNSEPYGLSAQTDMTVRGMTANSIGYVIEGMPVNDVSDGMGYLNQFVDSENLETISLAQGSTDLNSPVYSAAGGVVNLKLREPSDHFGGLVDVSYGSYHTARAFARIDTGLIGKTGIKGFLSYSYTDGDNWRGSGYNHRQHIDFKFIKEWGNDNYISFLGNWNYSIASSYYTPTKSEWDVNGIKNADNYSGNWDKTQIDNSNYWKLYQATFQQTYMAMPSQLSVTDTLKFKVTPYFQYGYGNSPYGTVLNEEGLWQGNQPISGKVPIPGSVDGQATVLGGWFQKTYRSGFTPTLEYNLKHHHLSVGYWYDYSDDSVTQPFTPVSENGQPRDLWSGNRSNIHLPDGAELLAQNTHTITQVNAIFLGDHMNFFNQKLFVDLGFKQVFFSRAGWNQIPGPQYRTGNNVSRPLPRMGIRYQFTKAHQVFASVNTNFAVPNESKLYNTYDPNSGALSQVGSNRLKSEYSIEEEIGYRYDGPQFSSSLTFFNYNYTNRLISTVLRENGAWVDSSINAGSQTTRGVDAEVGLKPWRHFSPYVSGEYLNATMNSDLKTYGDWLPTKGKKAVRSPTWQFAVGLTYDDGHFFANGDVKMVGKQYATFMNDESIGSIATGNVALGYRFENFDIIKYPELRLNLINITDQKYLSGVAGPTANAHDVRGRNGTVIPGSSPTYYIGGGFAAMVTATTAF
ncbi:Vitamin B12 transporter BtuB [Commensalibacter sp. Nvir]|uniref:TonB-dependent receptor n=1 Tax=Commensalibacter sp. Nvir TaxID=3069817 RepID=UPI002D69C24C|nr:Vitamin B12 transporter BtuB [Commensalibacter sp. Nvir]